MVESQGFVAQGEQIHGGTLRTARPLRAIMQHRDSVSIPCSITYEARTIAADGNRMHVFRTRLTITYHLTR